MTKQRLTPQSLSEYLADAFKGTFVSWGENPEYKQAVEELVAKIHDSENINEALHVLNSAAVEIAEIWEEMSENGFVLEDTDSTFASPLFVGPTSTIINATAYFADVVAGTGLNKALFLKDAVQPSWELNNPMLYYSDPQSFARSKSRNDMTLTGGSALSTLVSFSQDLGEREFVSEGAAAHYYARALFIGLQFQPVTKTNKAGRVTVDGKSALTYATELAENARIGATLCPVLSATRYFHAASVMANSRFDLSIPNPEQVTNALLNRGVQLLLSIAEDPARHDPFASPTDIITTFEFAADTLQQYGAPEADVLYEVVRRETEKEALSPTSNPDKLHVITRKATDTITFNELVRGLEGPGAN